MPEIVPGRPEALKGSAAAAVLLMLFNEDEAAQILSRLEPDEVRQLGYAMYDVQDVDPEEVNEALDHFVTKAKKRTTIGYGATRHIRGAMTKALGEERAETILARIPPPTRSTPKTCAISRPGSSLWAPTWDWPSTATPTGCSWSTSGPDPSPAQRPPR